MRECSTSRLDPASPTVTVLLPCLNEERTLGECIESIRRGFDVLSWSYEIVVADNGSTDGSRDIAMLAGARVVEVSARGYGNALRAGIEAARGKVVVMGDADCSYNFEEAPALVAKVLSGADLVMGNRFGYSGGIDKGAMPFLHRWLGNPVLSFLGRLFFRVAITDFHCGLRAFDRNAILRLRLATGGMEFASEMVVRAALSGLTICELPVTLSPDKRNRRPHLRTWRDGWRHLRFLLIFAPRWLYMIPGTTILASGLAVVFLLLPGPLRIGDTTFDINTMLFGVCAVLVGVVALLLGRTVQLIGRRLHLLSLPVVKAPCVPKRNSDNEGGRFLLGGIAMFTTGTAAALLHTLFWLHSGTPNLEPAQSMRLAIPAALLLSSGFLLVLHSFVEALLAIPLAHHASQTDCQHLPDTADAPHRA